MNKPVVTLLFLLASAGLTAAAQKPVLEGKTFRLGLLSGGFSPRITRDVGNHYLVFRKGRQYSGTAMDSLHNDGPYKIFTAKTIYSSRPQYVLQCGADRRVFRLQKDTLSLIPDHPDGVSARFIRLR